MGRHKALLLAGIITAVVAALTVGMGATFGQFGFADAADDDRPATVSGVDGLPADGMAVGTVAGEQEEEDDGRSGSWERDRDDGEHDEDDEEHEEHDDDEEDEDD